MRPFGVTKTDSVGDFGGQARQDYDHDRYGGDDAHRAASAGGTGVEVGSVVVVEEEKEGGGGGGGYYGKGTEVSSGCLGNLSPTAIVYMSAFVSSLTSVLLGYGEWEILCAVVMCVCCVPGVRLRVSYCECAAVRLGREMYGTQSVGCGRVVHSTIRVRSVLYCTVVHTLVP